MVIARRCGGSPLWMDGDGRTGGRFSVLSAERTRTIRTHTEDLRGPLEQIRCLGPRARIARLEHRAARPSPEVSPARTGARAGEPARWFDQEIKRRERLSGNRRPAGVLPVL